MRTYTTVDGETLDLSDLTDVERAYLAQAHDAFRRVPVFADFMNDVVHGAANPLLAETGG